jgi:hypothetical protein
LAGLALLALAACGDRKAANADSTLSRDLSLANAPAVQPPVFQDTAVSPAPAAAKPQPREEPAPARTRARTQPPTQIATIPRPTQEQSQPQPHAQPQPPFPVAAGPAPLKKEIGAGTGVALTMGDRVCTNTNRPGDKLVATVNTAVMGSNGAVIPVGSTIVLEVASVTPGSSPETAQITFRVRSVVLNDQTYDVNAEVTPLGQLEKTKVANPDKDADKRKVIGGAIAGAIAGKILGGSTKATVIGAAAGAATGAAVSRNSDRYEACLAAGSGMRMTLNSPLIIS